MLDRIWVVKENGEKEVYDPGKVRGALGRSGLSQKETDEVLARLEPMIHDGIRTKKIYSMLFRMIEKRRPEVSHRFNLKRALIDIGPEGYDFEDFMAKLLSVQGYDTELRAKEQGKCVFHEIDVIASKGSDTYMVECKFHNQHGTRCRIQTILYVYARFLDLKEGARLGLCRKFTLPWLVTNTKFSEDVVSYARCMGLPLLGWHYPEKSLEAMIEDNRCYPVSVIKMSNEALRKMLRGKMVVVADIPETSQKLSALTGISSAESSEIIERAQFARS